MMDGADGQAWYEWLVDDWTAASAFESNDTGPTPHTLPDFCAITRNPELVFEQLRIQFTNWFRGIFLSEGYCPLLIEIAAIQDERMKAASLARDDEPPASQFVSTIVSYADAVVGSPGASDGLLHSWEDAIKRLIEESNQSPQSPDFVPHPGTYRHIYFARLCRQASDSPLADPDPQSLALLASKAVGVAPSSCKKFEFHTPQVGELDEVKDVANSFVSYLHNALQQVSNDHYRRFFLQLICKSWFIVVPMFRQIEYAEQFPTDYFSDQKGDLSGRPGGCLLALIIESPDSPSTPADSRDPMTRLRLAAVRVSWLLQQAAMLETESKTIVAQKLNVANRTLLRTIGHSIVGPLDVGLKAFDEYASTHQIMSDASALNRTRAALRQAYAGAMCIDFLVQLDPETSTPKQRQRIRNRIQNGSSRVHEIAKDVVDVCELNPSRVDQPVSFELQCPIGHETHNVKGDRYAWSLVFQVLVKNAEFEASKTPNRQVDIRLVFDERRKMVDIVIENGVGDAVLTKERLPLMNRALDTSIRTTERHITPDGRKADGQGLGLVAVGEILGALRVPAEFSFDEDNSRVKFTIKRIRYA